MTEIEKLRKRTRKNWKRQMRSEYKRIMWKAEMTIENATKNYCTIEVREESRFATWLVSKKLEARGFKCSLDKAIFLSRYRPNDELNIEW